MAVKLCNFHTVEERVNVQRRGIFSTLKKMFGMVTEKKDLDFFFRQNG